MPGLVVLQQVRVVCDLHKRLTEYGLCRRFLAGRGGARGRSWLLLLLGLFNTLLPLSSSFLSLRFLFLFLHRLCLVVVRILRVRERLRILEGAYDENQTIKELHQWHNKVFIYLFTDTVTDHQESCFAGCGKRDISAWCGPETHTSKSAPHTDLAPSPPCPKCHTHPSAFSPYFSSLWPSAQGKKSERESQHTFLYWRDVKDTNDCIFLLY